MRMLQIFFGALGETWEREQRDALFLILAVLFTLIPHAQHLPLWVTITMLSLLGYRVVLTIQGRPLPSKWVLIPLALVLWILLLLQFHTILGRDAGIALLTLLMSLKLLEMQARRDVFVVLYLSFFLIITHFLYDQSILTAVFMLCALVTILLAQINLHFIKYEPPFTKKILRVGIILAQAAPLMIAMFLFFPRVAGPLWGLPKDAYIGKTGLSETMELGSLSQLVQSGELAFRVLFQGTAPPNAQRYWRGPVLDRFDGRVWYRSPAKAIDPSDLTRVNQNTFKALSLDYIVTLEPHNKPWVFALEMPLQLPIIDQHIIHLTTKMELISEQSIIQRVRYRTRSQPMLAWRQETTATYLQQQTQLPSGYNPRTLALAARWHEQDADPVHLLQRIQAYFKSQPFYYSLNPPVLGQQSIDEFLFNTRTGFCEHYASSFVVLARALGIPARVVTGYQGGEINPVDGFMMVRQSDAHAWAEVWLESYGWLQVDPTAWVAPYRIEQGIAPSLGDNSALPLFVRADVGWIKRFRFGLEAFNNAWNQWVLSFDNERQRSLLQQLGFALPDWRDLVLMLLTVVVILFVLTSLSLWWRYTKTDQLTRLYTRYCAIIAAQGIKREPYEGVMTYVQRIMQHTTGGQITGKHWPTEQLHLIQQGASLYADLRYQALNRNDYRKKMNQFIVCIRVLSYS